jgi:hypothetical protein
LFLLITNTGSFCFPPTCQPVPIFSNISPSPTSLYVPLLTSQ